MHTVDEAALRNLCSRQQQTAQQHHLPWTETAATGRLALRVPCHLHMCHDCSSKVQDAANIGCKVLIVAPLLCGAVEIQVVKALQLLHRAIPWQSCTCNAVPAVRSERQSTAINSRPSCVGCSLPT